MDPSALLPHVVLQHLQDMTEIHSVLPGSTWIYLDLPGSTWIYLFCGFIFKSSYLPKRPP